ncbi:YqaE/Pmp3 family membrane protein [Prosthecochloris sp. N3]|uniref:YqaE/Pmp3 family membrane protein n=1 Tax=Prosthecochloris ethylica TaxID=2743976 RepID=A0ABR9XUL5_9CHLB|nr:MULTISPECIES: YqaE/Pmp3 family membrane protein [Prosthecochloris]MEC9487731.1 YqaE/Pmp3 family membrane protein [Prosthecochloris sp.]MBF0587359.1 YqaE/Pmp3 family membrane protein [Prosthecochloris ethylica]MBF0637689.1 YqaE/Pmp3 family membrane protein [Prosthecochloris ethylica]NUK48672.1 YqaE/Pmp3 family membrane protein [Prosthecochloris ethylica]RNA67222.1 YqaE/Pmp3 family membrane protein [Prosthecochloris sp. ZM_2]
MIDLRKWLFAIICPPAAVLNKEVGTIMLVGLLTAMFWVPGVVAALFFLIRDQLQMSRQQPQV